MSGTNETVFWPSQIPNESSSGEEIKKQNGQKSIHRINRTMPDISDFRSFHFGIWHARTAFAILTIRPASFRN
jgi:hypothetical protein